MLAVNQTKGTNASMKGTSCFWPLDRGALTVSPLTKVCSAQPGVQPIHNPFALDDLHRCIDEPFVLDLTHDLMRIEHKRAALVSGWHLAGSLNIARKVTTMIETSELGVRICSPCVTLKQSHTAWLLVVDKQ